MIYLFLYTIVSVRGVSVCSRPAISEKKKGARRRRHRREKCCSESLARKERRRGNSFGRRDVGWTDGQFLKLRTCTILLPSGFTVKGERQKKKKKGKRQSISISHAGWSRIHYRFNFDKQPIIYVLNSCRNFANTFFTFFACNETHTDNVSALA